jgi:hypothetical protein
MSLRHSPIFALCLACVPALHAVRPPPAPEKAPAESAKTDPAKTEAHAAEPVPPYELKNKSVFNTTAEISRAPFWPIGWVKRVKGVAVAQAPVVEAPKVKLDEKSFKVTSILIGSGTTPSLAVINGRAYSEGEFVRLKIPGAPVRVRVQRINDGTVILENADQRMVAALQRPELSAPKPEQLLNDQDR